ncbi:sulfotransferase [Psychromarinibacter sp. C21-152]|uniref:Sulfotransferase n=1 Tax=Psychromarinibacter sediminicola TaxID=3033385 RepID=A0AAE3NQS0_9RHOB|nr:sulfotransferase [Psychromarinibacter sediminicola]MDF0600696.1 sulfotransferase [Psychromarinibacter sediminicola]
MLPLSPAQIPRLFKEARALETAGKLDQARRQYEAILQVDRNSAPTLFRLAEIDFKQGRYDSALGHLDRAAAIKPDEHAIWGLQARVLERIGDPDRTRAFLDRAKRAPLPREFVLAMQSAFSNSRAKSKTSTGTAPPEKIRQAIALLQSGDAAGAARLAGALRKAHPDVAIIADILANAQAQLGQPDAAEENFRAAVALDATYAEARANYGRFLVERKKHEAAIGQLREAVRLAPKMKRAWVALGMAYARTNRMNGPAAQAFEQALKIDAHDPGALLEYARLMLQDRQPEAAVGLAERALSAGADPMDSRLCRARALADSGRVDDALAELAGVLEEWPTCGPAYAARGAIHQIAGDFAASRADFRRALELMPRNAETYRVFLATEKLAADDPLIPQMKALFDDPALPDSDRASLGFALAKAMEDTRQHDEVFTYLRPANDAMRRLYPYDIAERVDLFARIREAFGTVDFAARRVEGAPAIGPIFVAGMPRSGTTLVEQIIASHSRVTGGGELDYVRRELHAVLTTPDGAFRDWNAVPDAELAAAAQRAEAQMRRRFPDADVITDKSVQTYSLIGPIRAVLPDARFVVVHRDPRDCLLSMYKNQFTPGQHLHSYSLKDLATYYHLFREIVAFWRETCPGWFHEIRYEDLIAEPEAQSRALIGACGLEWEDACLNFHQNTRRVDTLSVHQVRQPIYRSSMKAWERYADELGELFEALGEGYAPAKEA